MSQIDRVTSHTVLAALGRLTDALEALQAERMTAEVLETSERFRRAHLYTLSVIRSADPFLVSIVVLNNIEAAAQSATNEINAYGSNGNPGHLTNASGHVDSMLAATSQLPALPPPEVADGMRDALTSFRRSAGGLLAALERDSAELQAKSQELRSFLEQAINEINAQKGRIDAAISEYHQQFSQAEMARRDEFTKSMQSLTDQVSKSIEAQREHIQVAIGAAQTKLADAQIEMSRDLAETRRAGKEKADEIVVELEGLRDKAQELLHVIGNVGMAGEFQKAATSSRNRAFFWQGATVCSILGLVGFAIWTFYTTTVPDELNWPAVGTRAFVALAFGVLAAFSSRQADRSYHAEIHNRRYQLELSSIDPYLISLPPDKRSEVKVKLADKLFGATTTDPGKSGKQATTGTSLDTLKVALETIQDLVKKS